MLNLKTLYLGLGAALLLCALSLGAAVARYNTPPMPALNNYNCYKHIIKLDRDYGGVVAQCEELKLGRNDPEYLKLTKARLDFCYYQIDEDKCLAAKQDLDNLVKRWSEDEKSIMYYTVQSRRIMWFTLGNDAVDSVSVPDTAPDPALKPTQELVADL